MSEPSSHPAEEADPVLAMAAARLRVCSSFGPEFDDLVMAAVRQSPRPNESERRWRVFGVSRWATASQSIELPRFGSLAIAAGLAGILATGVWLGRLSVALPASQPGAVSSAGAQAMRQVEFVLMAPAASQVMLVGDFNGWSPGATPLRTTGRNGIWSVTIPLEPGRHEYAFLVDGKQWLPDPDAPLAPHDDFGAPNSILTVMERS